MKKILLASTALVLSAGLANAQALNITGEGRMGIIGEDFGTAAGTTWRIENRLTLNFNVSVQADHGLTFGAWMRARTSGTGGGNLLSGSRVWAEASGFRLTFGNQDGAIRGAGTIGYAGGCGIGYVGGEGCFDTAGLIGASQGQNSTGPIADQRVSASYTMGDTRFMVSHDRTASNTEIGVTTSFDAFTVAAGYSNGRTIGVNGGLVTAGARAGVFDDVFTLSARYNGGSWTVGALVARFSNVVFAPSANPGFPVAGVASFPSELNWQINGSVALGGGNLYGFFGETFGLDAYGLHYGYGLGGGATISAGWETLGDYDIASLGVAFNF